MKPVRWTFKMAGGLYLTRKQVPLKLAWAISIHKSQVDCLIDLYFMNVKNLYIFIVNIVKLSLLRAAHSFVGKHISRFP